jgi:hypothetical protein
VGGPVFAAPVTARGVVYASVAGDSGGLAALDAGTGDRAWRFGAAGAVFTSPAVTEAGIVVTDCAGRIYPVERVQSAGAPLSQIPAWPVALCPGGAPGRQGTATRSAPGAIRRSSPADWRENRRRRRRYSWPEIGPGS